jgi:murein DD-endopeptidase MepM/ murein hydrolase activator NlpD/Flp pilus assembly protein TadG
MPMNTPTNLPSSPRSRLEKAQSGQALVMMAVVIFTLFMVFMLLFEIGRLLVARESALSAARRAGDAAMTYLVDYAQQRADWNSNTLQLASRANQQIWPLFYDNKTGVPQWIASKAMNYLRLNLADHLGLVTQDSIDRLDPAQVVTFPYKEPNWPTATIGIQVTVTIDVPLFFFRYFGLPTAPITVQAVSIASVDELLGISSNAQTMLGDGGSASELAPQAQVIPGSTATPKWFEPYARFNVFHSVAQYWGCPKEPTQAYRYAKGRHAGIDLSLPEGTPLYAVTDGVVTNVGFYPYQLKPTGNNSVIIKTDDGFYVVYLHMLSFTVTANQRVKGGDMIGISDGDPSLHPPTFTGFTTGAHLHFQAATGNFYDYPNDVDPEAMLGLGKDQEHVNAPKGLNDQCF